MSLGSKLATLLGSFAFIDSKNLLKNLLWYHLANVSGERYRLIEPFVHISAVLVRFPGHSWEICSILMRANAPMPPSTFFRLQVCNILNYATNQLEASHPWLQIFFKIGGPKWPMEQKIVDHFLKWWAQAYQTKHSWYLGNKLYLHTNTDTCMHICILTADYTVKPV